MLFFQSDFVFSLKNLKNGGIVQLNNPRGVSRQTEWHDSQSRLVFVKSLFACNYLVVI